jgi:hypothetical protein
MVKTLSNTCMLLISLYCLFFQMPTLATNITIYHLLEITASYLPTSHPSISINNSPITEKLNSMMSQMLILSLDGVGGSLGFEGSGPLSSPAHKFWDTLSLSFPSRYSLPI